MENSYSNFNKFHLNRNKNRNRNRRMILEGGVVGLGIVAAMSSMTITNTATLVSSAKPAANFPGTNTNNGLLFSSSLNNIGTHFLPHTTNFLNSCNLCNKHLLGVDIFIYRGERAFCSAECREIHIRNDEYQDKCSRSGVMKPLDCSKPPCSGPLVSLAGIVAA